MTIYAYTDGASRGNPGESGVGVLLKDEQGRLLEQASGYLGTTTNNVAEYSALLTCLKIVEQHPRLNGTVGQACTNLIVYSDSELLVHQMNGKYRVKNPTLRTYFQRVHEHLQRAPFTFSIKHVERSKNKEADALANHGIEMRTPVQIDLPAR
ncbi:MAG: ribonuclease HI family protein [Ignavibacteriales bacterium]|nr:ribonuclease HI family protein [Ignavibacteriales bacterium]